MTLTYAKSSYPHNFCPIFLCLWITPKKLWKSREKAGKKVDKPMDFVESELEKIQIYVGIRCLVCGLFCVDQKNSRRPKTDHNYE